MAGGTFLLHKNVLHCFEVKSFIINHIDNKQSFDIMCTGKERLCHGV